MYRCPLAKLDPEPLDTERIKRRGWLDDAILVIPLDDPRLNWMERQVVEQIGTRIYGKRKSK